MYHLTEHAAFLLLRGRIRLPDTGLGLLFFLLSLVVFLAASSDSLLEDIFHNETLRKIFRFVLYAVAIILASLSAIADIMAE